MVDTSNQTLALPAETNSLVIEANRNSWAKCYLVGTERIYLGADDFSTLLSRLRDTLTIQNTPLSPIDGEIEGFPVVWRLSLAEAYHVLYLAVSGEDLLLFWENAHQSPVKIAGVMRLTPKHQQQWTRMINVVMDSCREMAVVGR